MDNTEPLGPSRLLLGSINVWCQLTTVGSGPDTVIWNVFLLFGKFYLKICKESSRTSFLWTSAVAFSLEVIWQQLRTPFSQVLSLSHFRGQRDSSDLWVKYWFRNRANFLRDAIIATPTRQQSSGLMLPATHCGTRQSPPLKAEQEKEENPVFPRKHYLLFKKKLQCFLKCVIEKAAQKKKSLKCEREAFV